MKEENMGERLKRIFENSMPEKFVVETNVVEHKMRIDKINLLKKEIQNIRKK